MTDHLIVRGSTVINIVWDLDRPAAYQPASDVWIPRVGDHADVGIGWSYDGQNFTAPPAPEQPAPAPTVEQLKARVQALEEELAQVKAALPA